MFANSSPPTSQQSLTASEIRKEPKRRLVVRERSLFIELIYSITDTLAPDP